MYSGNLDISGMIHDLRLITDTLYRQEPGEGFASSRLVLCMNLWC